MTNSKDWIQSLLITAVFNTIIAVVLKFMVIKQQSFFDVFVISQITGLSICSSIGLCHRYLKKSLSINIGAGLFIGVFSGSLLSFIYIMAIYDLSPGYYFRHIFAYVAVFGLVFGVPIIYFFTSREKLIESENKIRDEKIKRLSMEKDSAMISLKLLQAQIEPHFLFNTLSNVVSLMDIDVDKARQMLINVNEYLRISLQRTRQEMITLTQELDLVRQYLDIFKIRMGDRLDYEIIDRTGQPDFLFPPLVIQPLVENAIKYGLEPKVEGGQIKIDCWVEEEMLYVDVADTGAGLGADTQNAGIGINNVSKRLERIFGWKAGLVLTPNNPHGVKARIRVPL